MIKVGLLVKLVAKRGQEDEVRDFLTRAVDLARKETDTNTWFAYQITANTFGIFDTFPHEQGRRDHLAGEVAKALMEKAPHLFSADPVIDQVTILASKANE